MKMRRKYAYVGGTEEHKDVTKERPGIRLLTLCGGRAGGLGGTGVSGWLAGWLVSVLAALHAASSVRQGRLHAQGYLLQAEPYLWAAASVIYCLRGPLFMAAGLVICWWRC